jgi:hypothetical protein
MRNDTTRAETATNQEDHKMTSPTEEELATAPLIDNWMLLYMGEVFVLMGEVPALGSQTVRSNSIRVLLLRR